VVFLRDDRGEYTGGLRLATDLDLSDEGYESNYVPGD